MSDSKLVSYTNLTRNKSTRKGDIRFIIPHCFVGQVTAKSGVDMFTGSGQVSANYVVGKNGDIGQSVEEKYRAWTTGGNKSVAGWSGADADHYGITIETASDTTNPFKITDKAYQALIDLMADICTRYNRTKLLWFKDDPQKSLTYKAASNEMVVLVHRWFHTYKSCPGDYMYEHMEDIVAKVNAKIGAATTSTPSTTTATKTTTSTSTSTTVKSNLKVGDTIKLIDNAVYTSGKTIPTWVKNSTLYVREIKDAETISFSVQKTGDITGVIKTSQIKSNTFTAYKVKITALLNIRKEPTFSAAKVGTVKKNEVYTIVEEKNGFGKLKSGAGWIYLTYTKKV